MKLIDIFIVRKTALPCCTTAKRPLTKYDFGKLFYKFPCYLPRAAINEAYGLVSSYKTRLKQWQAKPQGKGPGLPEAGRTFPAMYREVMFKNTTDRYTVRIKVLWTTSRSIAPTLRRQGKNWSLDFPFEEKKKLTNVPIREQTVVSIDLGINNACVCSVMNSEGTILARRFLRLGREKDSLNRALQRIKNAQKQGNRKMPRLWAKTKGIYDSIAGKTADFIMDTAVYYSAHVIVIEKLDLKGCKHRSKKQRLHHWRAQYVQRMVGDKAHRNDLRVS